MELDHFRSGGHKQDFRILVPWEKRGQTGAQEGALWCFRHEKNPLTFLTVEVSEVPGCLFYFWDCLKDFLKSL